jgi:hypothetical protein
MHSESVPRPRMSSGAPSHLKQCRLKANLTQQVVADRAGL